VSDSQQPVAGSLSMRVIRACPEHAECPLECPKRTVEDLGEVARFLRDPSVTQRIKESYLSWRHSARPREKP
jgi:hypothetical protein